jgi:hypothetical protein
MRADAAWSGCRVTAAVLSCLVLAAGLSAFAMRASAAMLPVAGAQGAHLQLWSDPDTASFLDMSPGSVEHWQIAADLVGTSSTLHTQFWNSGGQLITNPRGLWLSLDRCDQPWTGMPSAPVCATGRTSVFASTAAASASQTTQWGLGAIQDKFLLVTLALPDTPAARADRSLQGITANVGFGVTAADGDPTPAVLASTGADVGAVALLALGAIGVGVTVHGARRIRRARS